MAILGVPIDLITSILPVFLITICGADALHMMNEFYSQKSLGLSNSEAAKESVRILFSPVLLTTVTTIMGFVFATWTQIENIRYFAVFMAFGLLVAQIISLSFVPACLCLVRNKVDGKVGSKIEKEKINRLGRVLRTGILMLIKNRRASALVLVFMLVLSGWSALHINVEDEGASYFRPENSVRISDDFINERSVGTSPSWITIDSGRPRGALDLTTLRFIEKLDQWLSEQPNSTYTYSIAKYIKRIRVVLHDDLPEWNRLPNEVEVLSDGTQVSGTALVNEAVMMYENGGGKDLQNVLNRDYSKAAILAPLKTGKASEYGIFLRDFDAWVAQNKPDGLKVSVAGTPVIWSAVLEEIVQGQVMSFVAAYVAVAVVLVVWLRSVQQGLSASLPLACTLILYFGAMSALDIDLNIGTALISYLVVGIVDYSVYFMHRVRMYFEEGCSADDAVLKAAEHAGSSIFFNILLFSLGFLTLLVSDFTPLRNLGTLVTMSLVISGVMALVLVSLLAPWYLRRKENISCMPKHSASAS